MRWLLLKDLQILRRSPLLVALLIAYPVIIAVADRRSRSPRGPDKPKVAFVNQVPQGRRPSRSAAATSTSTQYAQQLFKSVDPIRVKTRAEAIEKVRTGEALARARRPGRRDPEAAGRRSASAAARRPTVEVYYSAENPLKTQYVKDTIQSHARRRERRDLRRGAEGVGEVPRRDRRPAGRSRCRSSAASTSSACATSRAIIDAALAGLPKDAPERVALEQVSRFARLAADNLDLSKPILASISKPVQVKQIAVSGSNTSLSTFAAETAVVGSMMFVALLLAAGMLALEREENAFGRLVRGLVSRHRAGDREGRAGGAGGVRADGGDARRPRGVVGLDFGRVPQWLVALAVGSLAFGAMGVAIGGITREVRSASLAAFVVSLPVAALALIPSGAVSPRASTT